MSGWRRLHEQHAIVLDPATAEIRMANPFSAVPTAVSGISGRPLVVRELRLGRVRDLRGARHVDGRIETSCPDCGENLGIEVRAEKPDDDNLLFHCLIPAAHWWDDIVFT